MAHYAETLQRCEAEKKLYENLVEIRSCLEHAENSFTDGELRTAFDILDNGLFAPHPISLRLPQLKLTSYVSPHLYRSPTSSGNPHLRLTRRGFYRTEEPLRWLVAYFHHTTPRLIPSLSSPLTRLLSSPPPLFLIPVDTLIDSLEEESADLDYVGMFRTSAKRLHNEIANCLDVEWHSMINWHSMPQRNDVSSEDQVNTTPLLGVEVAC